MKSTRGRFSRWKNRWKKLRILKKDSDITISFLTGANMLNVSVSSKSKTIISMRGSREFDPNISFLKRKLYRMYLDPITFKFSDKIVSISDGLTHELGLYVGKKTKKKIVTIEVFVDAEEMINSCEKDPIEENFEKWTDKPMIVTTGRLSQEKGFLHLIMVFSKLLVEYSRC